MSTGVSPFSTGGSLAKAQADFKQTNDLNPKYAYAALWLDLAERRSNIPSHLAEAAKEANFYNGELSLLQGAKEEALRLLHLAANDCPRTFRQWTAANAELKALGMKP